MSRVVRRAIPTPYRSVQQCRAFFNFANFPAIPVPRNGSETQSYREQKIFPYRRSELYNIVADVESYPSFLPYCTGSRILGREARQDGTTVMEAELTVGFLTFKETFISTVTCKPHEFVEAATSSSSPLFKRLTTVWRLDPASPLSPQLSTSHSCEPSVRNFALPAVADQGPTVVTLALAFAFANPIHATVSATFFGQVSELMVKAFEERCVALYGPRT